MPWISFRPLYYMYIATVTVHMSCRTSNLIIFVYVNFDMSKTILQNENISKCEKIIANFFSFYIRFVVIFLSICVCIFFLKCRRITHVLSDLHVCTRTNSFYLASYYYNSMASSGGQETLFICSLLRWILWLSGSYNKHDKAAPTFPFVFHIFLTL